MRKFIKNKFVYRLYIQMNYELFKQTIKKIEALDLDTEEGKEMNYVLYTKYLMKCTPKLYMTYAKKYYAEESKETLYYMYTFTTKIGIDFVKAQNYILSIVNRKENLNMTDFAYSIEHEQTNKHFHVLIGSTRAIRTDAFKQYASQYGFVNRSRKIGKTPIQIVDYISKENPITWLLKDGKSANA